MNLEEYTLGDLFLSAIKSEIESRELYRKMANKTNNDLLKDKLEFLSREEEKHQKILEDIYKKNLRKEEIVLPKETPVPLPKINIKEDTPLSKLFRQAMEAEKAAYDFYISLAEKVKNESSVYNTLRYFSKMEMEHYKILELEKETVEGFEAADVYWPMIHAGP